MAGTKKDDLSAVLPEKPLRQKYQRLSELVVEQIISWIMDGTLRAEQRLTTDELAEKLGVSRMPVREALRMLERTGLVQSEPYLGARVAKLTQEDIEEIYMLRQILESTAGRFAAQLIQDDEIAQLEAIQEKMESLIRQDAKENRKEVFHLNREFHQTLYEASRKPRLCEFIGNLWDSIAYYRLISASSQDYAIWMKNEHRSYIAACKKHDGPLLEGLIRQSLQNHIKDLPQNIEKFYRMIEARNQ
ncbi:DNA-binding GntR family transcriptional regulator [Hydrogenispora ethanolica]|jgi:DNA-binding GntR family transcriptional regulator|uniref:DNA-binding GntR family transcriptional regulator n=1 Tax=Hydrogenispora ethanolica TaxID=1082276 RepID=A0A4R1SB19_HYDET|nr:GntR family transcriptional regulator [Hydrogenispora ethanolica]TCL76736.1 DNA-binding GntR family transcriptional regulator [Hydrogenispora ethanolica]